LPGDVNANLDEHIRLIRLASGVKADIIVFPELSLIGYELEMANELAFSDNDSRLDALIDVAESLSIILVVGAPVRLKSSLYIAAFILSPDRSIGIYTKHRLGAFPASAECDSVDGRLPPAESSIFQSGDLNPLVRLGDGHLAALAICADVGNPDFAKLAAERDACSYLASMFVIPSDFDGEVSKLRRYAAQHQMITGLANFGTTSGSLRSAGCSSIWSETGDLLVQLGTAGSGIAILMDTSQGRRTESIMLDQ